MSRLGVADLGLATLPDMVANASMIASLDPSVPLIADADTGYGGPIMVARTVTQYARAGVAALHIEDQVQSKRCGHLLGKELVDRETYYARLRAAVQARDGIGSDMLIIARTDARQSFGFAEAAARLKEAVRIGVDVVFFEAMQTTEEAQKVCEMFGETPVFLNMVAGGVTPAMTVAEAKQMGFRIMIFPGLALGPIIRGVSQELEHLKKYGTTSEEGDTTGNVKEAFELCGLQELMDLDRAAGGKAYSTVNDD